MGLKNWLLKATPEGRVLSMGAKVAGSGGDTAGFFEGMDEETGAQGEQMQKTGRLSKFGSKAKVYAKSYGGKAAGAASGASGAVAQQAKEFWKNRNQKAQGEESGAKSVLKSFMLFAGVLASIWSSLFAAFFPWLTVGVIVLLIILCIFWFKGTLRVMGIIAIIFLAGMAYWSTTTTGSVVRAQAGESMPLAYEASRGFTGPVNLMKQILTGEYDPTQMWTSQTYEDEYQQYTDVGVKIANVKTLGDVIPAANTLRIRGTVTAKSLPDDSKGTDISINAKWLDAEGKPNLGDADWYCDPDKKPEPLKTKTIKQTRAYYSIFECTHAPITVNNVETHTAGVTVDYDFTQRAGKQIYVVDYDEMTRLYMNNEDPITHYQLSRDELASWQTEGPINLGIGLLGDEDVIAAYQEDNEATNYIGVSVANNGQGKVTKISSLEIILPCEIDAEYFRGDSDFTSYTTDTLGSLKLCSYRIKDTSKVDMGTWESKTFFLPFKAGKDSFLKGASISSFFVRADLRFSYQDTEEVSVTVKQA